MQWKFLKPKDILKVSMNLMTSYKFHDFKLRKYCVKGTGFTLRTVFPVTPAKPVLRTGTELSNMRGRSHLKIQQNNPQITDRITRINVMDLCPSFKETCAIQRLKYTELAEKRFKKLQLSSSF